MPTAKKKAPTSDAKPSVKKHARGTVKIDHLHMAEYNPRRISKEAQKGLRKSIERFGLVQDIVVNRRNMRVVGGHQRVNALKSSGETDVPVTFVDLDETEEKALNIALNSSLISGEFDDAKLAELIKEIEVTLPDLSLDLRLDELLPDLSPTAPKPRKRNRPRVDGTSSAVVLVGDMREHLAAMEPCSVDAIVTDPPYGLSSPPDIAAVMREWLAGREYEHGSGGFMGREWDSFVPGPTFWREAFRVLKPGGHVLAFAGTRTVDLMAIAIRFAGFEVRDQLCWLYGSGFPKSLDVAKAIDKRAGHWRGRAGAVAGQSGSMAGPHYERTAKGAAITDEAKRWEGWGSALKPAMEPVVMARKPLEGTLADNVMRHGTGALNIDATRVGTELRHNPSSAPASVERVSVSLVGDETEGRDAYGRWPANVLLDEVAAAQLDEQSGDLVARNGGSTGNVPGFEGGWGNTETATYRDSGGASRFFYTAKASTSEREAGLAELPTRAGHDLVDRDEGSAGVESPRAGAGRASSGRANIHPTVKPVDLMAYLIRLVCPPGALVLDPFCGSGTTGCAAVLEGVRFVGVELDTAHACIAHERIEEHRAIARERADAEDGES